MSSEESGQDDSEDKNKCIVVKSLSWRSPLVDKFLESLDEKVKKDKSSQSLRQMKRRVIAVTKTFENALLTSNPAVIRSWSAQSLNMLHPLSKILTRHVLKNHP